MSTSKISSVQLVEGKKLLVKFIGGAEKIYACAPLLHVERFQLLNNEAFFKAVKVDAGGYGISWNDEVDLSEYELWTNGVEAVMAHSPLTPQPTAT